MASRSARLPFADDLYATFRKDAERTRGVLLIVKNLFIKENSVYLHQHLQKH